MSVPSALAKLRANKPITAAEASQIVGSFGGGPSGQFEPAPSLGLTGGQGGGGGGTGGGILGGLKDIGFDALKALATPGNALVTTLGNAGLALAGKPTMSWHNAIGAWEGRSPGSDLLGRLGATGLGKTLGGLGVDFAIDPFWLAGVTKIPRAVGEIESATGAIRGVEHMTQGERGLAHVADVIPEHAPVPTRLSSVKGTHDVVLERSTLHPLNKVKTRGRLVDDRLLVIRANKNNASPEFKIVSLANPKQWTAADTILPYSFGSAAEAEQAAHGVAQLTQDARSAGSLLEGGIVTPGAVKETLGSMRGLLTKEAGTPKQFALRLGLGKRAKTIATGVRAPEHEFSLLGRTGQQIGKALDTKLIKHPINKIYRALERTSRDVQAEIAVRTKDIAKELGLTSQDAKHIGVYLGVRRGSRSAADFVKGHMQDTGLWKPEYDHAINLFDQHYGLMAAGEGYHTVEDIPKLRGAIRDAVERGDNAEAEHYAQIVAQLEGRPYSPNARAADVNEVLQKAREEGRIIQDPRSGGFLPGANPFEERTLPHAWAGMTHEDVANQLETELGLSHEQADTLAHTIQAGLHRATGSGFADEPYRYLDAATGEELARYRPNLNAFELFSRRASANVQKQLEDETVQLLKDAGLTDMRQIRDARELVARTPTAGQGSLRSAPAAVALDRSAQFLKKLFTIVLPAHYIRNAAGDFMNDMVNGRLWHLRQGPEVGLSKYAKLIRGERQGDMDLINKVYHVGNRDYTGAELLTIARLSGAGVGTRLSHGFVGEDIHAATELLEGAAKSRNPLKRYTDFMKQLNVDRENAQRLRTWVGHMEGGDDMFTAAIKTVRTKFDYGDLTAFEKVWMRNVVLFYTWLRKNTMLHAGGIFTRPGLYAASGQMEVGRQHFLNEPGYMSTLGLLASPVGNIAFGSPIFDAANKFNLSQLRQSTIGQMTPALQIPLALATSTNPVTGQQFANHPVPSIFGYLPGIGTTASAYSRGPTGPAIDSRIAYILSSLSPSPVAAINAVTNPGYEGNAAADLLGRISGIQVVQNQPRKFAALAAIQQRAAKSQARTALRYNIGG